VEVHCDEGGANHIGPEPCVHVRENMGEASVGERIGQPLSFDKNSNPDADVVHRTEGKTDGARVASARTIRRGRRGSLIRYRP
jgi:hypothetical protein